MKLNKKELGFVEKMARYFQTCPEKEIDQRNTYFSGPGNPTAGCFGCHITRCFNLDREYIHFGYSTGILYLNKLVGSDSFRELMVTNIYRLIKKKSGVCPFEHLPWKKPHKQVFKEILEEQSGLVLEEVSKTEEPKSLPPNVIPFKKRAS